MRFLRNHRTILSAAAVFACCLVIFAVFWQLDVRGAGQKSRSAYLNDFQDTATQPVTTGIAQTFICDTPFHALGLLPSLEGAALPGTLTLSIYDGEGNFLASAEGKAAETVSGVYAVFGFPHAVQSPNGVYRLLFEADMRGGDEYALLKSFDSPEGWALAENGKPAAGALCILASVDAIGSFATQFYLAFAFFASAALCALFCLSLRKTFSIPALFVCCAATLGLLYCFLLPPYSAPAETGHINQAFNLSSRLLGQAPAALSPDTVIRRAGDHDVMIEEPGTTIFTYRALSRGFFSRSANTAPTAFPAGEMPSSTILHLPAALGLTLARLLHWGFVPALYLGRLFSLAAFVFLAGLAVKITPYGKGIFATAALLPLSIHLGASYNSTGLVLAAAMLFFSLCLRANQASAISLPSLAVLAAALLAVVSAKLFYLPLALLLLAIVRCSITVKGKPVGKLAAAGIYSSVFILAVAAAIGAYFIDGQQSGYLSTQQEIVTGTPAQDFVKTLLGGLLGNQNLYLNWGFTVMALLLLAFTILPLPNQAQPSQKMRWFACGAAVLCFIATAYLSSYHIQIAIYMVPILPILFYFFNRPWGGILKTKDHTALLLVAFSALSVFSLLDAFLLILTR